MATDSVQRMLQEAERLSPEDLLRLIQLLAVKARQAGLGAEGAPDWDDVKATIELPESFDAQAWVSELRGESERVVEGV
jgi:hypothetical protein